MLIRFIGDTLKESTLTATTRAANAEILERIKSIPNEKTILDKAQDNATSIMNMATQGYVTIIKNQNSSEYLAISSENANNAYYPSSDTWKPGTKLWKWSVNGFGYSKDGGRTFGTAITMDGAIVANYVTTGTMSADRIRTGILQDEKGNTNWNLSTGVLTMKKGSITLGEGGLFSVTDDGYMTAEYGKIGGFMISSNSIYNSTISLESDGLHFIESGEYIGYYGTQQWAADPTKKGLTINMTSNAAYMGWMCKKSDSDNDYDMKLMYTKQKLTRYDGTVFKKNRVYFGCDLDGNNYMAYNFFIDPYTGGADDGVTINNGGAFNLGVVDKYGSITGYITVRVQNGLLLNP